jgi:hypothetical protein
MLCILNVATKDFTFLNKLNKKAFFVQSRKILHETKLLSIFTQGFPSKQSACANWKVIIRLEVSEAQTILI